MKQITLIKSCMETQVLLTMAFNMIPSTKPLKSSVVTVCHHLTASFITAAPLHPSFGFLDMVQEGGSADLYDPLNPPLIQIQSSDILRMHLDSDY